VAEETLSTPNAFGKWKITTSPSAEAQATVNGENIHWFKLIVLIPSDGIYVYSKDGRQAFAAIEIGAIEIKLLQLPAQIGNGEWLKYSTSGDDSPTSLNISQDFYGIIQIAVVPINDCDMRIPTALSIPLQRSQFPYVVGSVELPKRYVSATVGAIGSALTYDVFSGGGTTPDSYSATGGGGQTIIVAIPPFKSVCTHIRNTKGEIVKTATTDTDYSKMCTSRTSDNFITIPVGPDTVCDCSCLGYWEDNTQTSDNLKCTKYVCNSPLHIDPMLIYYVL
jgi:hypothetical protein